MHFPGVDVRSIGGTWWEVFHLFLFFERLHLIAIYIVLLFEWICLSFLWVWNFLRGRFLIAESNSSINRAIYLCFLFLLESVLVIYIVHWIAPFQLKSVFAKTVHNILIFFSVSVASENTGSDALSSSLSLPLPLFHQGDWMGMDPGRDLHILLIFWNKRNLSFEFFHCFYFPLLFLYWIYSCKNYLHLLNPLMSNLLLFRRYLEDYSFDYSSFSFDI